MAAHNRRLFATARCRFGTGAWREAEYSNLSTTGCFLLIDGAELTEGSPVWIKIAELNMVEARVEWAAPGRVAVEFCSPLHVAVVDHIRRLGT